MKNYIVRNSVMGKDRTFMRLDVGRKNERFLLYIAWHEHLIQPKIGDLIKASPKSIVPVICFQDVFSICSFVAKIKKYEGIKYPCIADMKFLTTNREITLTKASYNYCRFAIFSDLLLKNIKKAVFKK